MDKLESNHQKLEWILKAHRILALDPAVESCSDIKGSASEPSFSIKAFGKSKTIKAPKSVIPADDFCAGVMAELHPDGAALPEFSKYRESAVEAAGLPSFIGFRTGSEGNLAYLTESENAELNSALDELGDVSVEDIDEGLLGKIVGGVSGFVVGPMLGKVVARALGLEKGILYDMLTSRLVTAALGVAIAKYVGGEYREK